jgi:hypothetical protein
VVIGVRGLISEPLDLEHRCRDKGREHEKAQNGRKGPVLDSWVHADQRDQQKSGNAKGDRSENVDWVC